MPQCGLVRRGLSGEWCSGHAREWLAIALAFVHAVKSQSLERAISHHQGAIAPQRWVVCRRVQAAGQQRLSISISWRFYHRTHHRIAALKVQLGGSPSGRSRSFLSKGWHWRAVSTIAFDDLHTPGASRKAAGKSPQFAQLPSIPL